MKTATEMHLRHFPVRIRDERTGAERSDFIVFDKRTLQAAQQVGLSSKDLIFREYNRSGFTVLDIGAAEKQTAALDLCAIFEDCRAAQ